MNHFRQGRGWLVLIPVAVLFVSSAAAQNAKSSAAAPAPVPAAMVPPAIFSAPSPVYNFRKLLAMSPQQLQSALARKSPEVRARILAKVTEYAALDPDERELRLRATELRWYLMPILRAPSDQRSADLAVVPANLRELVQSRLMEWEILPPPVQQEFLDNEHIAGYFAGLSMTNGNSDATAPSDLEQSHWATYSEPKRQAMIAEFIHFYDLSAAEKQKALGELTTTELKQTEATLQAFDNLPKRQRAQCIRAFGKFSNMSPEERAEFLKNAQRWSQMTPAERQAWRDLVAHVPQWPPLPTAAVIPPGIVPPTLTPSPKKMHTVATNNG